MDGWMDIDCNGGGGGGLGSCRLLLLPQQQQQQHPISRVANLTDTREKSVLASFHGNPTGLTEHFQQGREIIGSQSQIEFHQRKMKKKKKRKDP
jgi:hypothetical protein